MKKHSFFLLLAVVSTANMLHAAAAAAAGAVSPEALAHLVNEERKGRVGVLAAFCAAHQDVEEASQALDACLPREWLYSQCSICMEESKFFDLVCLPCDARHRFHMPCIGKWLMENGVKQILGLCKIPCPLCRTSVDVLPFMQRQLLVFPMKLIKVINDVIAGRRAVNAPGRADKQSLLHVSVGLGEDEISEILISLGAEIEAKDVDGDTPLCNAVGQGKVKSVEILRSVGANFGIKIGGASLLHFATGNPNMHPEIVKIILDQAKATMNDDEFISYINAPNFDGATPLFLATISAKRCSAGMQVMRLLLERRAHPNICVYGATALNVALDQEDDAVVVLLREFGATE